MRTEFSCIYILRVASGPWVKLAGRKNALKSLVFYSADRSKAAVPVLVLLFVALRFVLWGDFLCLALCYFVFVFLAHLSSAQDELL